MTKKRWLAEASHWRHGRCSSCGRTHDAHGKPLIVARRPRGRRFTCADCAGVEPAEVAA